MQIFLSHSSKQKPLVREIKKNLPEHLDAWIDEERLLIGDNLRVSLETVIKTDTDYLLIFLDDDASESAWVRDELRWALQAEKTSDRTIVLPVLLDDAFPDAIDDVELQNRKYLKLKDFHESSVRALAESITSELFALVCRDMQRLRRPKPPDALATISNADALVQQQAAIIQKAVFPHRRGNPVGVDTLRGVIAELSEYKFDEQEFERILKIVAQRNLIPGLVYDGFEIYLQEEHASWKAEIEHKNKLRIGRRVAGMIENGMRVLIDAGSTTEEVVKILCTRIENRALTRISIATTSVNIADMISDCCVKMGFDDDFSAVRLFIPGGQIRPSTQAIVSSPEESRRQLNALRELVGGFDLGIVGVNGVEIAGGFTTHANSEADNKRSILQLTDARLIVGDSSKVGLRLESAFATFDDDVRFVVDGDPQNERLLAMADRYGDKLLLV